MLCGFKDCERKATVKGLCGAHDAQRRAGKALKSIQANYRGLSEYDRFFKRVEVGKPNECWLWTGPRIRAIRKYGQWRAGNGKMEQANRAAWRLLKGEIPEGSWVLHKCDNPPCVNPAHLFLGSQRDNSLDMWSKGRGQTTKGSDHYAAKLTDDLVRDIRRSKERNLDLAIRLGIAPTTICDVRKRRTWKHIV